MLTSRPLCVIFASLTAPAGLIFERSKICCIGVCLIVQFSERRWRHSKALHQMQKLNVSCAYRLR